MKKNYLYLLIILSLFRSVFPMVQTYTYEDIPDLYEEAKKSVSEGRIDQALNQYKTITDITIPAPQSSGGFTFRAPYSVERKLQRESSDAILRLENQILAKAQELIDQGKYDEAEQELGIELINQENKDKAIQLANEVVEKKKNKLIARFNSLVTQEKYDAAKQLLDTEIAPEISSQDLNRYKTYLKTSLLTKFRKLIAEESYPTAQRMLPEIKKIVDNDEFKQQEMYLNKEQTKTKQSLGQKLEKERLARERLEKERLERERLERDRLERERLERERLEKERLEQERLEQEKRKRLEETYKMVIQQTRPLVKSNPERAFDVLTPLIKDRVQEAIALDKELIETQLKKAQTLINTGNYTEANKILNLLATKRTGSETQLKNVMQTKQNIATITTLYNFAQEQERQKKPNNALTTYKKIIAIKIPKVTSGQEDLYQSIRSFYRHAENQIKYLPVKPQLDAINNLIRDKKYTEASEQLGRISLEGRLTEQGQLIANEIAEKLKQQKDVEQKQEAAIEEKNAQAIKEIASDYETAQQREQDGNIAGALELYRKIAAVKIPAAPLYWLDSYRNERNLQQDAKNKIVFLETIKPEVTKADQLAQANQYFEALDLLDKIPAEHQINSDITAARNRIKNKEAAWINNQLQETRRLINEKNYIRAKQILDALKRITSTGSLEPHKLQHQITSLLSAIAHININRNYTEAYKILDKLINEGFTEAIAIKKEIEEKQQSLTAAGSMTPEAALAEVDRLFAAEEYGPAQTILEQLGGRSGLSEDIKNKLTDLRTRINNEQRRLRDDAIRQEEERRRRLAEEERRIPSRSAQDLKNAFIRLTATLKAISKHIGRR